MTTTELTAARRQSSRRLARVGAAAAGSSWPLRVGVVGVALIVLAALLAPLLTPYDPTAISVTTGLQGPSWAHPFGTDQLGRDMLTRVLFAARIDLLIGFVGVTLSILLGTAIGLAAGYLGGWADVVIGRVIDTFTAFPFIVLVIAIVAMLGPGLRNLYIAIALVSWVAYARIVRGEVLAVKRREYVLAARALGYTSGRIMRRHLLPNVIAPAIVFSMSDFVLDIVAAATLGFFGLGVQPPSPEWGVMIADSRNFITTAPWTVLFPGFAIVFVGFFFSLIGDGLADAVRRV